MKEARDIRLNYQLRKETFKKLEFLAEQAGFNNIRVYIVQKLIPNYYNRGPGAKNARDHPARSLAGQVVNSGTISNYVKVTAEEHEKIKSLCIYHRCVRLDESGNILKYRFSNLLWILISNSYDNHIKEKGTNKNSLTNKGVDKFDALFEIADKLDNW